MALTVEELGDALIDYLVDRFGTECNVVSAATDSRVALPAPPRARYYLGEMARVMKYQGPSISVIFDRTDFVDVTRGELALNQGDKMEHRVFVNLLAEAPGEEVLTRMCYRYARAFKACLDGADVFTTVTSRSCKVFVASVDYGVTLIPDEGQARVFRKEVLVECLVKHWDQGGPLGASPTGTPQQEVESSVVARATDVLLTTTSATTVVSYQPSGGGNFLVSCYLRIVTAPTDLALTLTWADGGGAQSALVAAGTQAVGPKTVMPIFLNATGNQPVVLTAQAGTASQVFVSATIEALG